VGESPHKKTKKNTVAHTEQLECKTKTSNLMISTNKTDINMNGNRSYLDAVEASIAHQEQSTAMITADGKRRLGENACLEFTNMGLGSNILALSQMVRGGDPRSLCDTILSANPNNINAGEKFSARDVSDLMILLFVTRNARGGKGEKDLSYHIFLRVWEHYPSTAKQLLRLFPHYGYWKDLLLLSAMAVDNANATVKEAILQESIALMKEQLLKDEAAMAKYNNREVVPVAAEEVSSEAEVKPSKTDPGISLVAKWLPRENTALDKKLGFVNKFTQYQPQKEGENDAWKSKSKADYRKLVAKLTALLELPEVFLCAQRADEMNLHRLASKATLRLSKALLNETKTGAVRSEDPKRIRLAEMFVDHTMNKGLKGGQLMPHEIVRQIMSSKGLSPASEKVLDALWKDLWKKVVEQVEESAKMQGVDFDPTKMVPLSDVSGSMTGIPMEVAIALGIGISEITHPAFQNMVLTFEEQPRWHKLNASDSIVKKVQSLARAPWGGSTNFEGAYDEILKVCMDQRLSREDVPVLIVFSDMQFNQACSSKYFGESQLATMHDVIRSKFATVAKALGWKDADPTPIVYWNLITTEGHPVEKDTAGSVLLSGFSPSLLKLVMNGEALKEEEVVIVDEDGTTRTEKVRITPEEVLRKMLDCSLYDPVREVLAASNEGALIEFEPPMSVLERAPTAEGFELI
jgi:Domain of unknown function (DUF2828)